MRHLEPLTLFFLCLLGGFTLAALFIGGLMATNAGVLGVMLRGAKTDPLPLVLLWTFLGIGFAGGQWGTALAMAGSDDD